MQRPLIPVLVSVALAACSGGGTPAGGGGHGGGTASAGTGGAATGGHAGSGAQAGSTGAAGSVGAGGATGACSSTSVSNTILASFSGYSLSVVGQDAYYVDPNANMGRGDIRHVMLDGTGDAPIVDSPTGIIFGVTAVGANLFYFLSDDAQEVHMFQSPRATGGVGTQLGTGTFDGFSVNILGGGYAGIMVGQTFGVFAQSGTDVFVHDGTEISRVSTVSGTKTVIAADPGTSGGLLWPALVGNTVFYKDGTGVIYSVAADATAASGLPLGTATCGSGRTMWMSSYTGGFLCGELFGIDKVDPTGTTKSHVIYTLMDKNPTQFNPSQVDGTTYYALPKDATMMFPIYKLDVASTALTPFVCAVGSVIDYKLTSTDLVYIELNNAGGIALKRVPR